MANIFQDQAPAAAPLALRPKDAAAALGISERLLWDWTHYEGLPCVRIQRTVLYPVDEMKKWLAARAAKSDGDGRSPDTDSRNVSKSA